MCVYEFVTFFEVTSHKARLQRALLSGHVYENTKGSLESCTLVGTWANATEEPLAVIFDMDTGKFPRAWERANLGSMSQGRRRGRKAGGGKEGKEGREEGRRGKKKGMEEDSLVVITDQSMKV